jgi:hypothetical protein
VKSLGVPTDLTIWLADQPGAMAGACDPAGAASQLHILVDEAAAARATLMAAGYNVVSDREVIVYELADVPGSAGKCLRRIADAGVNLELVYLATATRLVIGVDDLAAARAALA